MNEDKIKHGILVGCHKKMPKIYITWLQMKQRCFNRNYKKYYNYGGRGVIVCERWKNSFENFYDDMNKNFEKHIKEFGKFNTSIDRIDNNGNYELSNCKWATKKEQQNNTRYNRIIRYKKERYTLQQFCDKYHLKSYVFCERLKKGWTIKEIVDKKNHFKYSILKSNINNTTKARSEFINEYKDKICLLPVKWQMIIIYRFGLKNNILRTLKDTGKKFNLSKERIRQLEVESLKELVK